MNKFASKFNYIMFNSRFSAFRDAQKRDMPEIKRPFTEISDYFGKHVFGKEQMRATLSNTVFKKVQNCIDAGEKMDSATADAVANSLKAWAISKGATHFTHWFHPIRGNTAEKHDTFFELKDSLAIEQFRGSALVKQEPDASSFPHGGIRSTFEARGYTAWDPSSPAFIYEIAGGRTLCIPTIFVAYTGQALDNKAPLLKTLANLDKAATAVCQYFDKDVKHVSATLGAEQEYFLIDRAFFYARPDLIMSGRTLFGHASARGQQLSDHYFGSIPGRVTKFMMDFEYEAHRLGIPVRTRHNEVAPGQFEVAPQFEEANLAVDHNVLLMDVMERIAEKHNFGILFHEKPFQGINGSGKHNNWALVTNKGRNLLAPSSKGKENLQFLTFLICVIKAVKDHANILRAGIASAGNDLRLGAHEAPPAIISVFIGTQLTQVLKEIEENTNTKHKKGDNIYLKLGINKIPEILLDNTDRNRTSPFAFTGNKFEFRAVGSTAICSVPLTNLNTAVTETLLQFKTEVDKRIQKGLKKEVALLEVLQQYIKESKPVLYEGDNYSADWVKEAQKRKLPNLKNAPEALKVYKNKNVQSLFEKHGIFTKEELAARTNILLDEYVMKIQIESRLINEIAMQYILPAAFQYQKELLKNYAILKTSHLKSDTIKNLIQEIAERTSTIQQMVTKMTEARKKANQITNISEKTDSYANNVIVFFDKIRYEADKLEQIVADQYWPIPKYKEMLFIR